MFLKSVFCSFLLIHFSPTYGSGVNMCAQAIDRVEREENIPRFLIHAISIVESGRWDPEKNAVLAHPWTINVNGKGEYFKTKEAAIKRVQGLVQRGVKSIDIGCMQINMAYHAKAFLNIEEAFDPYYNVLYAAKLLKKLMTERNSWAMAVGHYHSSIQPHYISYRKRVYDQWSKERLKDAGISLNHKELALSKSCFKELWTFQLRPQSPIKGKATLLTAKVASHLLFPLSPAEYKG